MGNNLQKEKIKCDKCKELGIEPKHFRKNVIEIPDRILMDKIPLYDKYNNEIKEPEKKIKYEYICSNGHSWREI